MAENPYVTDGDWGAGTGIPHTAVEADEIIWNLESRIKEIEENPPSPHQISNVTVSGGDATVHLDNGDAYTFAMPVIAYTGAPVGADVAGADVTDGGTFTPALADLGHWFTIVDGDCDVILDTVDPDAAAGAEIHLDSDPDSGGIVTVPESTDITVKVKPGFLPEIGAGGVATVKKLAAGVWRMFGDLVEDVSA